MKEVKNTDGILRSPIVAVLGHVDHGKTSLLDTIRQTSVTRGEAGGITQSIGASSVITSDKKKITFIDTPGHASFSQMRSRGANVADIVILVVAADDGPKPQTLEAIEHIRSANVPMIVAFTKIDLNTADLEQAQTSLENNGIYFEGRGGDVPWIAVSSKTKAGIKELLDLISLMAEINDIKGNKDSSLEAVIIETAKDKRGQLVSVVVRNGQIKVGDEIVADGMNAKVKGIFDENIKPVREILPGEAGQILGFTQTPQVGAKVEKFDSKKDYTKQNLKHTSVSAGEGELGVFLKTKTSGSLEALIGSLPKEVVVTGSGVGDVTESDVLFAKSAGSSIFTFEAKASNQVLRLADTEGVKIESFPIIYELIQRLEEIIKKDQKEIIGKAEIQASFPYENKKVAGSKIVSGIIKKTDQLTLVRGEKEIGKVKISSMKKGKQDILEAKAGEELGIIFYPQLDFETGDVLLSIGQ